MDRLEHIEKAAFDKEAFYDFVIFCRQRHFVNSLTAYDKAISEINKVYPEWRPHYKNFESMDAAMRRKRKK